MSEGKTEDCRTKADYWFVFKEGVVLSFAAGVCCVHLWRPQMVAVSILFGVVAGGFASVAIVAGLKYWYRGS